MRTQQSRLLPLVQEDLASFVILGERDRWQSGGRVVRAGGVLHPPLDRAPFMPIVESIVVRDRAITCSAGCGIQASSLEDSPDRGDNDQMPQLLKPAADALIILPGIVPRADRSARPPVDLSAGDRDAVPDRSTFSLPGGGATAAGWRG
jgi:hypothetical protein